MSPSCPQKFTEPSFENVKASLELLPIELKHMIIKSLRFTSLYSLCIASKPYRVIAHQGNLFTRSTMMELESRIVKILPRDVIIPKSCTRIDITARINGCPSPSCTSNKLAAALHGYFIQSREKIPRLRIWECFTLLSELIDVVQWTLYLNSPPEKLAMDVHDPMERIVFEKDTHAGRTLDPSNDRDAHELSKGDSERWSVRIEKEKDCEVVKRISHLHDFCRIDTSAVPALANYCAENSKCY